MVINSKGKLYEEVLSQIIIAIIEVKDLYIYSAHKAFLALKIKKNENNPSLAKLCIYLILETEEGNGLREVLILSRVCYNLFLQ